MSGGGVLPPGPPPPEPDPPERLLPFKARPAPETVEYRWRTWGGSIRSVEADDVVFAPAHVVFMREGRIVMAVANSDVTALGPAAAGGAQ